MADTSTEMSFEDFTTQANHQADNVVEAWKRLNDHWRAYSSHDNTGSTASSNKAENTAEKTRQHRLPPLLPEPWESATSLGEFEHHDSRTQALAQRMLGLLVDWRWMDRRNERIDINTQRQTRRRLTFDFTLSNQEEEFTLPLLGSSGDYVAGQFRKHPPSPAYKQQPNDTTGREADKKGDSEEDPTRRGTVAIRGGGSNQMAVPLTFLRKGMLVNLDLVNAAGEAIPSLGTANNTVLTYYPLQHLGELLNIPQLINNRLGPELGSTEIANRIHQGALLDIIMSRNVDKTKYRGGLRNREQEIYRKRLFGSLAALAFVARRTLEHMCGCIPQGDGQQLKLGDKDSTEAHQKPDKETLESLNRLLFLPRMHKQLEGNRSSNEWASDITAWMCATKDSKDADSVEELDSSPLVTLLAIAIIDAVKQAAGPVWTTSQRSFEDLSSSGDENPPQDPCPDLNDVDEKLLRLCQVEFYCTLLSTLSTNYLFSAAIDFDRDENTALPVARREIIKLSCDAETTEIDSWRHAGYDTGASRLKNFFGGDIGITVPVRYAAMSANSTHLEIGLPDGARLASITAGELSGRPFPLAGFHQAFDTRWDHTRPKPEDGGHATAPQSDDGEYGSCRSSQKSIHIVAAKEPMNPIGVFYVNLLPSRTSAVNIAAAVVCAVLLTAMAFLWCVNAVDLSVTIALVTLLVGTFGALFFSIGTHRVTRRLYSPVQAILNHSTIFSVAIFPIVYLLRKAPIITEHSTWQLDAKIAVTCISVAFFISLLYRVSALSRARRRSKLGESWGEKVAEGISQRSRGWRRKNENADFVSFFNDVCIYVDKRLPFAPDDRDVIAATETGAFDSPHFFSPDDNWGTRATHKARDWELLRTCLD
ncbi:hypothetical protein [Corynebacterium aquilae]|uniref:Uncharacterized protein n=1 Tax=Corynebacterium aquilae DSM 44791 TaxID=1431546 RepID=A0A1L7CGP3_9CORY|nr:hypothetical protein [Corynebacterium aquilae]APT85032.1 hypothetical protein CAQU_08045 [Corynebacterium aquilae DSM 44791]